MPKKDLEFHLIRNSRLSTMLFVLQISISTISSYDFLTNIMVMKLLYFLLVRTSSRVWLSIMEPVPGIYPEDNPQCSKAISKVFVS